MMKQWIRTSRSLVLRVATVLLASTVVVSCTSAEPPAEVQGAAVQNVLINAGTIEKLAPGEDVLIGLGAERVRYYFDFREPIDFTRVALQSPSNARGGMDHALMQMKDQGFNPLQATDLRFSVAADASFMVELNASEVAELNAKGKLIKTSGDPTKPKPQSVDECHEVTIYIVTTVEINGQTFTLVCEHTIVVCEPPPCDAVDEVCNGVDDDCDGEIDDGANVACSSACGAGEQVCHEGQLGDCNAPEPVPVGDQVGLQGTLRDFNDTHPDFESYLGTDYGIVQPHLGADDRPLYAGQDGNPSTHGQAAFDQWFRDVPGVNQSTPFGITLTKQPNSSIYTYVNNSFFPLDGQLFGNQGRNHNFHFTYELNTPFLYSGGEVFEFTGDDDLWVFINNQLVIDIGGVHPALNDSVTLDDVAAQVGIYPGNVYNMRLFFAERHTVASNFRIDTTIAQFYTCD